MINLAGNKDADVAITEELYLANIDAYSVEKGNTEVPYSLIGKIGKWTLRRAWNYWVASVEYDQDGLPLQNALELHNMPHPTYQKIGITIRAGGDCSCPSPDSYVAQPIYNDELNEKLKKLGYKEEFSEFLNKSYISINYGEVADLCNSGKLDVQRYVKTYHIDDQIGLNEFAKYIKAL